MNRVRDRIGLNVPPLLLRLMLGAIFIWAGLGKVSAFLEVEGEQAAVLANMGVISAPGASVAPPPLDVPPATPPATPPAPAPAGTGASLGAPGAEDEPAAARMLAVRQVIGPKVHTAADFPKPVSIKRVYGLALSIHTAANPPAPEAGSTAVSPIWPAAIGNGRWPVYLAWAVTVTELGGGLCVLLGLFTRLWSLGLAGVMLGAMWLNQVGPMIQSGETILGFLPNYAAFDTKAWQPLLFQFSLFIAAAALSLLGPGRASLDHVLLGGRHEDDDED